MIYGQQEFQPWDPVSALTSEELTRFKFCQNDLESQFTLQPSLTSRLPISQPVFFLSLLELVAMRTVFLNLLDLSEPRKLFSTIPWNSEPRSQTQSLCSVGGCSCRPQGCGFPV